MGSTFIYFNENSSARNFCDLGKIKWKEKWLMFTLEIKISLDFQYDRFVSFIRENLTTYISNSFYTLC